MNANEVDKRIALALRLAVSISHSPSPPAMSVRDVWTKTADCLDPPLPWGILYVQDPEGEWYEDDSGVFYKQGAGSDRGNHRRIELAPAQVAAAQGDANE